MCAAVRCMSSLDPVFMVQHAKQLENTLWILLNPKVLTWFPAWKNLAEYKPSVAEIFTNYKTVFCYVCSFPRCGG